MGTNGEDTQEVELSQYINSLEEEDTVIGIGSGEPFENIRGELLSKEVPFVDNSAEYLESRINPALTTPAVKSIIAIGVSYNKKLNSNLNNTNSSRVNLSIGSIGVDYHRIVYQKLEAIKRNIQKYINKDFVCDIFVDTGCLVDREVGVRCGLGSIGKSGNLINPKLGSIINIGYMLTDLELKPNNIITQDFCKDCSACLKACPTRSIQNNYSFNYKTCISYLTQKKELDVVERELIKSQLYGCDICQLVCPYNKGTYCEEFNSPNDINLFKPTVESVLRLTNKEFKETYKNQACGWRGKKVLQRNAIIGLANNTNNNKLEALKILSILEADPREDIQEYLEWAKSKLNN